MASSTPIPPTLPTIWRIPDEQWHQIAPVLVVNQPRPTSGRPRSADRPILDALIHLARTGSPWCT